MSKVNIDMTQDELVKRLMKLKIRHLGQMFIVKNETFEQKQHSDNGGYSQGRQVGETASSEKKLTPAICETWKKVSIKRELKTYANSKQLLRIFGVDVGVNHTKGEITQVSRTTLLALTDFLVFAFM